MDRQAIVTKAGDFWNSCKTCSKKCLCFCGLKDPKRVAVASVAIIGLGILIYRGWHREIPHMARAVARAPGKLVKAISDSAASTPLPAKAPEKLEEIVDFELPQRIEKYFKP